MNDFLWDYETWSGWGRDNSVNWNHSFVWDTPARPKLPAMYVKWADKLKSWWDELDPYIGGPVRWEIEPDNVSKALDVLGINWSVTIQPFDFYAGLGAYMPFLGLDPVPVWEIPVWVDDQEHCIVLNPWLNAEAASMCLWHELTHAKQAEAFASPHDFHDKTITPEYSGSIEAYFNDPIEIEAYANMDNHYLVCPLMR